MQIGCLGISANPPHLGHHNSALVIRNSGLVDAVWLVPCFEHPFRKSDMASWNDRVNMTRFLEDMNLGISVSLAECQMSESEKYRDIGKNYTIHTLAYLREKYPGYTFRWCVGSDIVASGSYHDWHRWDELENEEMILVVERPGYPIPKEGLPKPFRFAGRGKRDISSTEIRNMVKDEKDIKPYVGSKIAQYIHTRGLYI